MKNKFNNRLNLMKFALSGICILLLVVACQISTSRNNDRVPPTKITFAEQEETSPNLSPVPPTGPIYETATTTPIPSPTRSITLQSITTPLLMATVMPTTLPTLSPDEAMGKVNSLLEDTHNSHCLLPCWWGATPGQTYWQDLSAYLTTFALAVDFFPEQSLYVAMFPVSESINYRGKLNIAYTIDASEIVTAISIAAVNVEGYDPQIMMTLYGVPDEVWLKSSDEPREGILPFHLIVVYQQKGISLRYYVDATRTGDMITACFEPGTELERPDLFPAGPRIYVWAPGQHKEIEEISPIPGEIYFPLEVKTDLTLQTLYERFTNPDEQPCIDTPVDAWM